MTGVFLMKMYVGMILGARNIFCILIVLFGCNRESNKFLVNNTGYAQGTTYSIKYYSDSLDFSKEIDSIFNVIDLSLSHYLDSSLIKDFNNSDDFCIIDKHFRNVYLDSKQVSDITFGSFDCTVYPLIKFWGFLKKQTTQTSINYDYLDSILNHVGYKNIWLEGDSILFKKNKCVKIDFNGIAQGYTVDVVCDFLEKQNIFDYLVEIGGEVRANNRLTGKKWKIGIEKPIKERTFGNYASIVVLDSMSLATSGNYRKFNFVDGEKFSHHISPFSGKPINNEILSVSVISKKCSFADAFSSAFMIMGIDSIKSVSKRHNIDYFVIYKDVFGDTVSDFSDGFKDKIVF